MRRGAQKCVNECEGGPGASLFGVAGVSAAAAVAAFGDAAIDSTGRPQG